MHASRKRPEGEAPRPKLPVVDQLSAGGVVVRRGAGGAEVALVAVGPLMRWQLPKGIVETGEAPEATALREVREEAGVDAALVEPLGAIDYWYVGDHRGARVRFHKTVHFFLLDYRGGDVRDHDREVREARWVELDEAEAMLAFRGEREVVARAAARIGADPRAGG
jgi:8-oxo-dGTP pyrophosphatase MutT (NUDIX family)